MRRRLVIVVVARGGEGGCKYERNATMIDCDEGWRSHQRRRCGRGGVWRPRWQQLVFESFAMPALVIAAFTFLHRGHVDGFALFLCVCVCVWLVCDGCVVGAGGRVTRTV